MKLPSSDPLTQLGQMLGVEHLALLVQLLEALQAESGYGDIVLVFSAGRIQNIKLTRSYKVKKPVAETCGNGERVSEV